MKKAAFLIIVSFTSIAFILALSLLWLPQPQDQVSRAAWNDIPLIRAVIDEIRPVDSELASTLETYFNQEPVILEMTHQIMSADLSLLDNPDIGSNCKIDPSSSCHLIFTPSPGPGTFDCGIASHYPGLVSNVFTKLNQEDWNEDGNWGGDWQDVNDATAFAPSVLYQCAIGTDPGNAAELNRRANQTIDYEIRLIDEVIQDLLNGIYDYEKIGMALGGQNNLVAARLYYPPSEPNTQKVQLYSRALAIGPALAMIYDPSLAEKSPYSPVSAVGYLAYYNFSLAEITQISLEQRLYVLLGRYLVKNNMEAYWQEDNYGGYYKSMYSYNDIPINGPLAFEQGLPLSAWAKLFKFDSDSRSFIEPRLPLAITTHDNLYKNNAFVETAETIGNDVKFLSSNLLISRGLIYIYEALHDSSEPLHQTIATHAKNRAMDVLTFINNNFFDSAGRYLDHHLIYDSIKSGRYCTGCNFQALDNIDLLWKIYNQIPPIITTPTPTSLLLALENCTNGVDDDNDGDIDCYDFDCASNPLSSCCPVGDLCQMGCPTDFGCVCCNNTCYEAGHVCQAVTPTPTPTPFPTATPTPTPTPTPPLGDTNGDGEVNSGDVILVLENLGDSPDDPQADINNDGKVNMIDLAFVIRDWGSL